MYTDQQYLQKAEEIINKHSLEKYLDTLLDYWEQNPTTLGHGFEHVLKAAVEVCELAELNGYRNPEELFVGGLLHDIYRPAKGESGKEDHHETTAKVLEELFPNDRYVKLLISFLYNQEEWRGKKKKISVEYDQYLFIGDKIAVSSLLTNSYVWASNHFSEREKKEPVYDNHQKALYHFYYYQLDVWDVFMQHQDLKGVDKAMDAFLEVVFTASDNYQNDRKGENFLEYIDAQAAICRSKERDYLSFFKRSDDSIKRIMSNMI